MNSHRIYSNNLDFTLKNPNYQAGFLKIVQVVHKQQWMLLFQ